jgi:16S rRNA (cytidine1402-2'-O)-methyltransferase
VGTVASEDARKTCSSRFEIRKPQIFHEHNGSVLASGSALLAGKSVAMVSCAGTPASDRSSVRRAIAAGEEVTLIPGPTALVMALVLSGLAVHSFTFRGFPPHKRGPRRRFLEVDRDSPHTLVFYESPYRLAAFLCDALEVYGDRDAALAREMTKIHETVQRGRLSALLSALEAGGPKGEYVVVIAGAEG